MPYLPKLLRRFGTVAALLLVTSCSGNGTSMSPGAAGLQSRVSRPVSAVTAVGSSAATQKSPAGCPASRIYVADDGDNSIKIYPAGVANPSPCGIITAGVAGPGGIYVDAKGKLYVSNINSNAITEYPRDATSPSVTITAGVTEPVSTFVGTDGTLYVPEYAKNTVLEFDRGARSPSRTISLNQPIGVATDGKNDLYVSYDASSGGGRVDRFAPKSTTGTDLGISVGYAGDVKFIANTLLLGDQNADVVNVYAPGKSSPSRSISTAGVFPYRFALNRAEKALYVVGYGHEVAIYDVKTGAPTGTITSGLSSATGVALDPVPPYAN